MSRLLLIEPIGGISGDMFLAAAFDLGLDPRELDALLRAGGIDHFRLEHRRATKGGLSGTQLHVALDERDEGHAHGLHFREIRRLLGHPAFAGPVAERASAIFERLALAEGKIHGVSAAEVHFHEVGALDSIVDVIGAAWALDRLGSPEVYSRPPPLGSGMAQSEHGPIPIPAPATLELLRGWPVLWEGQGETTTPTGAAILAACASFAPPPSGPLERTGYGIGHADWTDRPNVLRLTLSRPTPSKSNGAGVGLLEAHLDDASPQLLGHLMEILFERGALDVAYSPLFMKKGRPGQRLTVVCREAQRAELSALILREATSLGVRWTEVERDELDRHHLSVETEFGAIRVKVGTRGGEAWNVAPEYDDCVDAARRHGIPLKRVLAAAAAAAQRVWSLK
ncbi:MAG: nickel pincer cofactor biosynthesis protein LarC [Deltaproteobacteria bacterium]